MVGKRIINEKQITPAETKKIQKPKPKYICYICGGEKERYKHGCQKCRDRLKRKRIKKYLAKCGRGIKRSGNGRIIDSGYNYYHFDDVMAKWEKYKEL